MWYNNAELYTNHSTIEPELTLESKVDFSELVLVPEPIILESKSTIPPSHILLLDIDIDHDDSMMIFQDWSFKGNKFQNRIFRNPIHIGDCKYVNRKEANKGRFCESDHHWNHHLKVIFSFSFFFFMYLCIHSYIEDNTWDRCGEGFNIT